jgi:hypothetical protein
MIKLEFSGSGEEVRNEIMKLLGLQDSKAQTESPVKDKVKEKVEKEMDKSVPVTPTPVKERHPRISKKTKTPPQPTWTKEEAEKLFTEIQTNAKRIIIELAKKPEGYRRSDLIQELGITFESLRGQLSSVGSARRRMGNKPPPIMRDKVNGEFMYRLDTVVANVAKQQSVDE